jgi:hypothetical protein
MRKTLNVVQLSQAGPPVTMVSLRAIGRRAKLPISTLESP